MADTERIWHTGSVLPYADNVWERDNALFTLAWRQQGMDSKFIVLGEPTVHERLPLILATREQMTDAGWWRQWGIEGIVFTTWGMSQNESIARAIRESGTKLILIMDSDGLHAPRTWFKEYLWRKYASERDRGSPLPSFTAIAKTLLGLSKLYWKKTLVHLSYADLIAVQSPLAVQLFRRFLAAYGRPDLQRRVVFVPHGVSEHMRYDGEKPKSDEIITVGRWDSYQKNAPLLIETLGRVLANHSEYRAQIVGKGQATLEKLTSTLPQSVRVRINIAGPLSRQELAAQFRRAKIFLSTSRYEGFCISPAEALCCGCSVVGPDYSPPFHYICTQSSGALTFGRSADRFVDAVATEIRAWDAGDRNPACISEFWTERLHASRVAEKVLAMGRAI